MKVLILTVMAMAMLVSTAHAKKQECADEFMQGIAALKGSQSIRTRVTDATISNGIQKEIDARLEAMNQDMIAKDAAKAGKSPHADEQQGFVARYVGAAGSSLKGYWRKNYGVVAAAAKNDPEIAWDEKQLAQVDMASPAYVKEREKEIGETGLDVIITSNTSLIPPWQYTYGYVRKNRLVGYRVETRQWTTTVKFEKSSCNPESVTAFRPDGKGEPLKLSEDLCQHSSQMLKLAERAQSAPKIEGNNAKCRAKGGKFDAVCKCYDGTIISLEPGVTCPGVAANNDQEAFEAFVKAKGASFALDDAKDIDGLCKDLKPVFKAQAGQLMDAKQSIR